MRPLRKARPTVLRFCSLASSSAGNATLIEAFDGLHHTHLLVDCGLNWRQLQQRLTRAGCTPEQLCAIFITHEHSDHIGHAPAIALRLGIPLLMSAGTWHAVSATLDTDVRPQLRVQLLRDGDSLALQGLSLHPFTVPHDAREPLQLRCSDGQRHLGILTDLGHVTPHALQQLAGCHALVLESNHCPDLLAQSRYPPFLRQRVGGPHGHLSNPQAAHALQTLHHPQLHTVMGAHLSEQNNHPDLVRHSFAQALHCSPQDVLLSSRAGLDWLST